MATDVLPDTLLQREIAIKSRHQPYEPENWLSSLVGITFRSVVLAVSPKEAEAILNLYRTKYNIGGVSITQEDGKLLYGLEQRIDEALSDRSTFPTGNAFARMSNRSPKDGYRLSSPSEREPMARKFEELKSQCAGAVTSKAINTVMRNLFRFISANLKISTGAQVVNLLTTSERVYTDLLNAKTCSQSESDVWSTNLILREWQDDIDGDFEFRAFVKGRRITAISQYNPYVHLPDVVERLPQIREAIGRVFQDIRDQIPVEDCVLDFAYLPTTNAVMVVELNPLEATTGAGLYSWEQDHGLLLGEDSEVSCGRDVPIIRMRETPLRELGDYLEMRLDEAQNMILHDNNWKDVLSNHQCTSATGEGCRIM